ncbi:hypothetical protein EsH8_VIII_001032 [Colletotrichum jinshuiense]
MIDANEQRPSTAAGPMDSSAAANELATPATHEAINGTVETVTAAGATYTTSEINGQSSPTLVEAMEVEARPGDQASTSPINADEFITISYGARSKAIPKPSSYNSLHDRVRNMLGFYRRDKFKICLMRPIMPFQVEIDVDSYGLVTNQCALRVETMSRVAVTVVDRTASAYPPTTFLIDSWCHLRLLKTSYAAMRHRPANSFCLLHQHGIVRDSDTLESLGMPSHVTEFAFHPTPANHIGQYVGQGNLYD